MYSFEEYTKQHGLKASSLAKFGLCEFDGKVVIPIKNKQEKVVGNRYRHLNYNSQDKSSDKFTCDRGFIPIIFNSQALLKDEPFYVLTEGEIDAIRLDQEGIPAISGTCGAATFKKEWLQDLVGKTILICYDTDTAGKTEGLKVAKLLFNADIAVKIIRLPEDCKDVCEFFYKGHSGEEFGKLCDEAELYPNEQTETETPHSVESKVVLLKETLTYEEVEAKVTEFIPNSEIALRILLAVAASARDPKGLMLWFLFVGVPSSGKTDVVRLIKHSPSVYFLDNMTLNAFISGERETESSKVYDLLPKLDGKCLVVKDWTPMFSLDEKAIKKLLGDLVGIYDKEFSKFSSRRGIVSYKSAFSQMGCITPVTLNKHTHYLNMVGPRYLYFQIPDLNGKQIENSFESVFSESGERDEKEEVASLYVSSYLNQIYQKSIDVLKPLSKEHKNYLKMASQLMSKCRGTVLLQSSTFDKDGKTIHYYETIDIQIEQPWRAAYQLLKLARYLAFTSGKNEVTFDELVIIKEVVLSSMPSDRSRALKIIRTHQEGLINKKVLAEESDVSSKTSHRLLEELAALGILKKIKGNENEATTYELVDQFKDFILLDPAEFLSSISNEVGPLFEKQANVVEGVGV